MSAEIIPFPQWRNPKTIDSEEDMVAWAIWTHCVQTKRYSFQEAEQFGRAVWGAVRSTDRVRIEACKRKELDDAIHDAPCGWLFSHDNSPIMHIHNFLRVQFKVQRIEDISAENLQEAIDIVRSMELAAWDFLGEMSEIRKTFVRQVFSGGEAWTPWVKRSLKRDVGDRPDWRQLAAAIQSKAK